MQNIILNFYLILYNNLFFLLFFKYFLFYHSLIKYKIISKKNLKIINIICSYYKIKYTVYLSKIILLFYYFQILFSNIYDYF